MTSDLGSTEPGLQTIELRAAPVTPGQLWVAGAVAAGAAILVAGVLGWLWPELASLGLPVAGVTFFLLVAFRDRQGASLQIRQHALSIRQGPREWTLPYADLFEVRPVRHAVHSELVLEHRDGTVERFGIRGFWLAKKVADAIEQAAAASARTAQAEDPRARRALDALRGDLVSE